jgi:hypothetical protein
VRRADWLDPHVVGQVAKADEVMALAGIEHNPDCDPAAIGGVERVQDGAVRQLSASLLPRSRSAARSAGLYSFRFGMPHHLRIPGSYTRAGHLGSSIFAEIRIRSRKPKVLVPGAGPIGILMGIAFRCVDSE